MSAVIGWIESHADLVMLVLAGITAIAVLAAIIIVVVTRRQRRTQRARQLVLEGERLELEVALAEQTARLRIIRELHEVSVHEMTALIGQADGARYAGSADAGAAVRAVGVIADSARIQLGNLRRVMSVVRGGEAAVESSGALARADELFALMRQRGLVLVFEELGEPFTMTPGAEVSVFRILQEALTNALTHGGPGTEARVVFTWTTDGFQVVVDDDGIRSASRRDGLDPNEVSRAGGYELDDDLTALTGTVHGAGITEMRERAELFGGVFTATAVPGVGFTVTASFPDLRFHNGIPGVTTGE